MGGGSGLAIGAGAVFGALVTAILAWGAVDLVVIPRVVEHQVELCTEVTEKVAANAVAAEQLRQFRIGERAAEQFFQDSEEAADDAQAERELFELQIEHYAQRVRTRDLETGDDRESVCALDADALELGGVRQATEQNPAGSN